MANQKASIQVSPNCVAAYAWLAKPDEGQEFSDGKYKVTMVFNKGDAEVEKFIETLKTVSNELATAEFKKLPSGLRMPLKDGDDTEKEDFQGKWLITAKTKFQPGFVASDKSQLAVEDCPSSGDLIKASFQLKAYNTGGNKGVTSQLRNVMLIDKRNLGQGAAGDFGEHQAVQKDSSDDDDFDIAI